MSFFTIVYVAALILLFVGLCALLWSIVVTRSPYLSLSRKHIPNILDALDLVDSSVFYELGCGDARIVIAAAEADPKTTCFGVELALAPWLVAKFNLWRARQGSEKKFRTLKNITIRKENMFKTDLSQATHVFCYLYPGLMQDLHTKFKRELPPGAKVVSCDFEIKAKKPEKIIPLSNKTILGKNLYMYRY